MNMTVEEAKNALFAGHTVSHEKFMLHEFVMLDKNDRLWDEDNNELDWNFFWSSRNNLMFETGWFIKNPTLTESEIAAIIEADEAEDELWEEDEFEPCCNCDLPDACADYGCAIDAGLKHYDE